ncbi:4'-phosphopantetheinyl transferase family protein [Alkalilimnicola sp. S0819]|uniref:4'-phosphopantetheinyl transferase family protein n=1 Tax=Alkalilimnicola sp. S0819 TaxID=2613922 RepID=UPI00186A5D23|nr:4'-phosphopantetheinyl transferase superfamily protein [Alkalilimnicola sp. S0819]
METRALAARAEPGQIRSALALGDAYLGHLPLETVPEARWPALEALLDAAERERAARFHFDHDRRAYIAAHALLRATLSALTGLGAPDLRFSLNVYGKPELVPAPGVPPYRVNLSHTRGLAAVAVSLEQDVGVDVEWLGRRPPGLALADRYFAPSECAWLAARPEADRHEALLTLWTLKEAYIKAVGLGLSLPLDAFAFELEPLTIRFSAQIEDRPERWCFQRYRPTAEHLMALALRTPAARPRAVHLHQVVAECLGGSAPFP